VILLHREDAYEKDSPRAGEADFIVAKHRGGGIPPADRTRRSHPNGPSHPPRRCAHLRGARPGADVTQPRMAWGSVGDLDGAVLGLCSPRHQGPAALRTGLQLVRKVSCRRSRNSPP
jgi:hypothetical protein